MATVVIIGFGKIAHGLIGPIFKQAGYSVVAAVRDYSADAPECSPVYTLQTPLSKQTITLDGVISLDDVTSKFDLVITAVGRQNVPAVAAWYKEKKLSAPVLLAENLPDPGLADLFPQQIPIVIDRICPRMTVEDNELTAFAEDYYKIVVQDHSLTHALQVIEGVELLPTVDEVEYRRKQKMFTVNAAHLLTVMYGQEVGCDTVEQAIVQPAIANRVRSVIVEIGPWIGLTPEEAEQRAAHTIQRFGTPLSDPLSRVLKPDTYSSAVHYLETPLKGLQAMHLQAPLLTESVAHLQRMSAISGR